MSEVTIRPAEERDSVEMQQIYAHYVEYSTATFEFVAPTVAEFEAKRRTIQERYPFYVAELHGRVVGYAYAHAFYDLPAYDWTAEVTIYLAPETAGQGIGARLADQLEATLKEQGIRQAMACITATNEASIAFHRKRAYELAGTFERVGYKHDTWLDVVWYAKNLQPFNVPESLKDWRTIK